jgi:hypothetical protein
MMRDHDAPEEILDKVREICLALPDAYEEDAWAGTRWCVRKKNFAHVVRIDHGKPEGYASAAGLDGAITLTFRSSGPELNVLANSPHPFFKPVWFENIAGLIIDEDTDWDEVQELLTESYCVLAPKTLAAKVTRPGAT